MPWENTITGNLGPLAVLVASSLCDPDESWASGTSTFAGIVVEPTNDQTPNWKILLMTKLLHFAKRAYPSAVNESGFSTQG